MCCAGVRPPSTDPNLPWERKLCLQLVQAVILRDTQNMPDTKLVPSFLQLLKLCIAHHYKKDCVTGFPLIFLSCTESKVYFSKKSATIRSQLCAATVPKGSLLSLSHRSLFEGCFIGCLWEDWGRVSFFSFSLYFILKKFSFKVMLEGIPTAPCNVLYGTGKILSLL